MARWSEPVNKFDVRVYAIRRRPARRRPFEVRWQAAGRARSKSFITRTLADSYRAELVRAARQGLEFDPATGEPVLWAGPEPVTVTWYQHAAAYAAMKWPGLAAHSRASLADALATVTPALTRTAAEQPPAAALRTALYQHAFNPARPAADAATARVLDWVQQASLPVARLADPVVLRQALDALTLRLDGGRAAANTVIRKRAVFHGALGYAVETGLLESNPADRISWRVPRACPAVDPKVVASPAQAEALLAAVARIRPELTAFFGCLYYGALRPEEAVALRQADCCLPGRGWGMLTLAAAAPRSAAAWTSDGTSHEQRGLKHRPDGAIRKVPIPPILVKMLRIHTDGHGTAPDGRLFPGARGGLLSESVYGRAWHTARPLALGPRLAATALARRPCDLRHAALSLWLNAGAPPAQIAARAGHRRHRPADRLRPLRRRPGPDHQPAHRTRPAPRQPGTVPQSKRLGEPPVPPGPCPLYVRAHGHPGGPSHGQPPTLSAKPPDLRKPAGKTTPPPGRHPVRSITGPCLRTAALAADDHALPSSAHAGPAPERPLARCVTLMNSAIAC